MQKITGPEPTGMTGFVLVDLDGAPAADGVVRSAKKILVDGARTMARSRTYAWALLGRRVSGASAGVSVSPEHHAAGIAAFVAQVRDAVGSGALSLDPGKGVTAADLSPLGGIDARSAIRNEPRGAWTLAEELLATSALAATSAALGGLDGRTVAIEGAGDALPSLVSAVAAAGARVVAVSTATGTLREPAALAADTLCAAHAEHGEALATALGAELPPTAVLTTEADVLLCGSKLGLVDHDVAAELPVRVVAPIGAVPVTAKGLAVAGRRDVVVLPDFLTTAGPLLAFRPEGDADADALVDQANAHAATLTAELLDHPDGPLLGACMRAEEFLRTWRDELPFGRPLA